MQAVFIDNWIKATGRVLHGEEYFPPLPAARRAMRAQMFSSSPTGGSESMHLMYLMAITAAEHSIELSSSYFVPDELDVRRWSPRRTRRQGAHHRAGRDIDTEVCAARRAPAGGRCWKPASQIAEYQPTMYHCKVLVVDGLLVSVGSTNFDNRSFRLNDEANLNVFDAAFAQRQSEIFDDDMKRASR